MIFLDDSFKMSQKNVPKKHKKIFIPSLTLLQMPLMSEVVWGDHVFHGNSVLNFSLCISSVSGKNSWSCLIHNFRQLSQFGLLSLNNNSSSGLVPKYACALCNVFAEYVYWQFSPQTRIFISLPKFGLMGWRRVTPCFPFTKKIHTKMKNHWISPQFLEALYIVLGLFFIVTDSGFTFLQYICQTCILDGKSVPETHSGCNLVVHTRC